MSVTIKKIQYKTFGEALEISNGSIEAVVTTDIGPLILRYAFVGGSNIMFNDDDGKRISEHPSFAEHYYEGAYWRNYGGNRLWVSPEKMPNTYYPYFNKVDVELLSNGAVFTQEPQTANGVALKTKVVMDEEGNLTVTHNVKNITTEEKRLSAWSITVLNKGGLEIVPNNDNDTGLLPNRRIVAWPYTNLADDRVYIGKKYITLRQDHNGDGAFKLGLDNRSGTAMYAVDDNVFVVKYEHDENGEYDDFGCSFESYTNEEILELETLSAVHYLAPGETVTHTEHWSLHKNSGTPCGKDEQAIDTFFNSYTK